MKGHEGANHITRFEAGVLRAVDLAGALLEMLPPATGGPHLVTAINGVTAAELFEQGSVLTTNPKMEK